MTPATPPQPGRRVLAFVDGRAAAKNRDAIARLAECTWPPGLDPEVVDTLASRELADWYGVVSFPAVAIVDNGMLVAIEHDCSVEACARLLKVARRRGTSMRQV